MKTLATGWATHCLPVQIPRFWSQATTRAPTPDTSRRRKIGVHRWGWSDTSQVEASAHAGVRLAQAVEALSRGERVRYREKRHAYDAGDGVPIREEIVLTQGAVVITRNLYGALCLNTPRVMFIDLDDEPVRLPTTQGAKEGLLAMLGLAITSAALAIAGATADLYGPPLALAPLGFLAVGQWCRRHWLKAQPLPRDVLWQRVAEFAAEYGGLHLRVYETPAGLRVLVMNGTLSPCGDLCARMFEDLGADPHYVRMCRLQRCFRARVSPKPWRIERFAPARPPREVWPLEGAALAQREAWVAAYNRASEGYAACRFARTYGAPQVSPEALEVQLLHDQMCRALEPLPLA